MSSKIEQLESENKCLKCERDKLVDENNSLKDEVAYWMNKYESVSDTHQSDCIRINQLQVTVDTLVDRYARLRELKGL